MLEQTLSRASQYYKIVWNHQDLGRFFQLISSLPFLRIPPTRLEQIFSPIPVKQLLFGAMINSDDNAQ